MLTHRGPLLSLELHVDECVKHLCFTEPFQKLADAL